MQNWFGEPTTIDHKEFLIKNRSKILKPSDDPLYVHFRLEYDPSHIPSVDEIRVNGVKICSSADPQLPQTPGPGTRPGDLGISVQIQATLNQCGIIPLKANPLITHGEKSADG